MRCELLRLTILGFICLLASCAAPCRAEQSSTEAPQRQNKPNPLDRWFRMSPEEREKELAKLPPQRARMIREQLQRYNQMPPEEKEELRERYRVFISLPPAQQQIVRERLQAFRALPVPRRLAVHREVLALRALPAEQRPARMNSDEIQSRFSPQERQIISDLAEYLDIKRMK